MAQVNKEQKYDIDQFVKFLPGDRVKSDVFRRETTTDGANVKGTALICVPIK